ncbi:MAG TPA: HlyD family secretion protein [Ferrovibrio sp.]|uniref:HlyD family secretion protein n=1 Tax=Ferrovibrio sp. TaxID=1917215 RepID=UPI002ED5FDD4
MAENRAAKAESNIRVVRDDAAPAVTARDKTADNPGDAAAGAQAAPRSRRRRWRAILLLAGPLLVIAVALWAYLSGGRYVSTDNAYVRADKLAVSTDISGIVASIEVKNDQTVAAGQVLFRLDDEPYRIALAGAEAQLGNVRNEIATLQATYRQMQAQVQQARTDTAFYETNFRRQQDLLRRGVVSQSVYDQAKRDLDAARERLIVAQHQAEATLAQLGGDADAPIESNPRYLQAKAQVDQARRNLRHTVVSAPTAGVVTNVDALQVGAYLPAAQTAFNLVSTEHVWVEASPKETDLTYLSAGDRAVVTIDSYPGREWPAVVDHIDPATGAEFSVLPAQNASGNWVKVVQRVPVQLRLEPQPGAPPLRAGMSANVEIDTGHSRSLGSLFSGLLGLLGLG